MLFNASDRPVMQEEDLDTTVRTGGKTFCPITKAVCRPDCVFFEPTAYVKRCESSGETYQWECTGPDGRKIPFRGVCILREYFMVKSGVAVQDGPTRKNEKFLWREDEAKR